MNLTKNIFNYILVCLTVLAGDNLLAQEFPISAEDIGIVPEISNVRISPDGNKILMIKRNGSDSSMEIRSLIDATAPVHELPHSDGFYTWARWLNNNRIIFRATVRRRSEKRNQKVRQSANILFKMNSDGTGVSNIKPNVGYFLDVYKEDRNYMLMTRAGKVHKVNIDTLETEEYDAVRPDGRRILDNNDVIRAVIVDDDNANNRIVEGKAYYRKYKSGYWIKLYERRLRLGLGYTKEDTFKGWFTYEGVTNNPSEIYVSSYHTGDKLALYKYNVDSKEIVEKIAGHDEYNIYDFKFDDNNQLISYRYNGDYPVLVLLDDLGNNLARIFSNNFPGSVVRIQNESEDKSKFILFVSSPTEPGSFYLLDLNTNKLELLDYNYQNLDVEKLSKMVPISYQARDGLTIPGFLSLPINSDGKNLPTIIFPHDGPISRTNWGFNTWTQFLTSRGFAVLQMNYRGSTGLGQEFRQKGFHEWGRKILEDINDGTHWMIDQGYADPDRICTLGHRYGGYAALQVNVLEPQLYKCAITDSAIVDLGRFMNRLTSNYIESTEWSPRESSPLHNAENINVPLLVFHGSRSEWAEKAPNKLFVNKMKRRGNDITYIVYEDIFKNNNVEFFTEIDSFLAKHLKE